MGDDIRVEIVVDFEDIVDGLAGSHDEAHKLIKAIDNDIADVDFTLGIIQGLAKDLNTDLPGINANIEKAISETEEISVDDDSRESHYPSGIKFNESTMLVEDWGGIDKKDFWDELRKFMYSSHYEEFRYFELFIKWTDECVPEGSFLCAHSIFAMKMMESLIFSGFNAVVENNP